MVKNIVFFDTETTGVDADADEIIQIALIKTDQYLNIIDNVVLMIKPSITISESATEVHGITNEMVVNCNDFSYYAKLIHEFIDNCDIAGYNIMKFDCVILNRQLLDAGIKWNYHKHKFIDAYKIFVNYEKRTLQDALKKYCGEEHDNAHDATADTVATIKVFKEQMKQYDLTYEEANIITSGKGIIDIGGKFGYNDDGEIIFTFGKHVGKLVKNNIDYLNWMLSASFSTDTKNIVKMLIIKFK